MKNYKNETKIGTEKRKLNFCKYNQTRKYPLRRYFLVPPGWRKRMKLCGENTRSETFHFLNE